MNNYFVTVLNEVFQGSNEAVVEFLHNKGMLKRQGACPTCSTDMMTVNYSRNKDGLAFRCYKTDCGGYKKYHSVRINSVLSNFTVPLRTFLRVCWKWYNNHTQVQMSAELDICQKTLVKIVSFLRDKCMAYFVSNPVKLGGYNLIVEIDEKKYHRGRQTSREIWVFGLIDTSSEHKTMSLHIVDDRKAETLLPIIDEVCLPGTIIHSDMWKAYGGLSSNSKFVHRTVNHSENFVDPSTGVNTQTIESQWNKCKYFIKMHKGVVGHKLEDILAEFMWKANVGKRDGFDALFGLLRN